MASILLASGSPRRKQLLEQLGYDIEVAIPQVEERRLPSESAVAYVHRNARLKANSFDHLSMADDCHIIVSADTIVVLGEKVLEKPKDHREALDMLGQLSGRCHQVISGFCLVDPRDRARIESHHVITTVWIKTLSSEEIASYCASDEPYDKAGGYGAQGRASYMIQRIEGSYTNVVGLPLCELTEAMISFSNGRVGMPTFALPETVIPRRN